MAVGLVLPFFLRSLVINLLCEFLLQLFVIQVQNVTIVLVTREIRSKVDMFLIGTVKNMLRILDFLLRGLSENGMIDLTQAKKILLS